MGSKGVLARFGDLPEVAITYGDGDTFERLITYLATQGWFLMTAHKGTYLLMNEKLTTLTIRTYHESKEQIE